MASTKIPLELTAYAPDADGATLELQTTDTTVTDGSVLGKIEFKAPKEASGTDAILVGAAIEAVAEGTFAADNNATELVFKTGASEAATQKMVLTSGGSVGIAQSSPSSFDSGANKLVVGDTSVSSQGITIASDTNSIIYFADGTSGSEAYMGSVIYNHTNNNMTFRTNGFNTAMVIDSSQNVGIGTSSISSWTKLQVQGTAGAQTGAYQALHITSPTTTANEGVGIRMSAASGSHEAVGIIGMVNNASGNSGSMTFHTYNGGADIPERMRLDSSGNLLVGKTVSSSGTNGIAMSASLGVRSSISGNIAALFSRNDNDGKIVTYRKDNSEVGSISTNTNSLPSDRNFKREISDLDLGLNLITKLKPSQYNYKIDDENSPKMYGLIAQDLEKSLEEVGVEKNSVWLLQHEPNDNEKESDYSLDYLKLTPVLINAIQELSTELETAKARIKTLEEA